MRCGSVRRKAEYHHYFTQGLGLRESYPNSTKYIHESRVKAVRQHAEHIERPTFSNCSVDATEAAALVLSLSVSFIALVSLLCSALDAAAPTGPRPECPGILTRTGRFRDSFNFRDMLGKAREKPRGTCGIVLDQ